MVQGHAASCNEAVPDRAARDCRTFQNIALFKGMTSLDNIMTGRFTHMTTGFVWQSLWKGKAEAEEVANREKAEEIIDFFEIQHIRKTPVGRLPDGLQKRVELGRGHGPVGPGRGDGLWREDRGRDTAKGSGEPGSD